ncbi:eIF-2-alpha kinase GCN2 isoform X2 [Macadamia integrifolia]|uniref:eIF-2-alpha kinase GCN2 isoform X2 n=1 Tax=Macadamia integrifolia TaxID=60698 RepID=UPI001C4EE797|nr:eIF-2-alpha kinase GCN2 isoform X2 [Macadamia integrifolia]
MGHISKKKKRSGGGGRKSKGRVPSKDHVCNVGDDGDVLSDELTALAAIFQEDFEVVSDSPPQFIIKIRPYSKDTESEDLSVSALLIVRCLPGYPYKCPKLQITPERGLSKDDADKLLALLYDQVSCSNLDGGEKCLNGDVSIASNKTCSSRGPFVYGLVDLFKCLGGPWNWGLGVDKDRGGNSPTLNHALNTAKIEYMVAEKQFFPIGRPTVMQDTFHRPVSLPTVKLDALKEESEDEETRISNSSMSLVEELLASSTSFKDVEEKELISKEEIEVVDDRNSETGSSESLMSDSVIHDHVSHTIEKDLIMVHLLRLACASQGVLANGLPEIASELHNLGLLSDRVRDLVTNRSWMFNKAFRHVFQQHMVSSPIAQFWKATTDFGGQNTSSPPSSRYLSDFEELRPLGHGGFGRVMLCRNKLDGRQYAVKKIYLMDKSPPVNNRILREVATLSRLQHQHVVRYYQAWFETEVGGSHGDTFWGSRTGGSSSCSYRAVSSRNATGPENKVESTYLYIQMEYCPGTLRQVFESDSSNFQKENAWHYFRQIVEGLVHIHGQGIIHRDLTPSNIFFDARNDIKIGDFGLAKFLKLEQVDHDPLFPPDTVGVSVDGTGQVGTYFYTAPEIEQGWPKIDEKVDMYSLGVVFFELWHPFGTAMERHIVLSDLKQNGALPSTWEAEFPEQASLLWRLMSPSPSDRPSATELLEKELPPSPPQGENQWLDEILQRMQTSEDRGVYHKVVNAIFLTHQHNIGSAELARDTSSFIQYTEIDTEFRDNVVEVAKEVFRQHGAKRMEITPMSFLDDKQQFHRDGVKLLSCEGDMLELCHELRLPFVNWVVKNQVASFKRYEISWVYREGICQSPPDRYLQGDFDIIGGASILTEVEVIKATMDVISRFFQLDSCDIRINHGDLLEAMWTWIGIEADLRHRVSEVLSIMGSLRPQSPERKSKWVFVRRQLLQDLNLAEAVVNRLQTVGSRFCGTADQALPRLRGALPPDKSTLRALEELASLCSYLRVWRIEKHVFIDTLMPPTEGYHREIFFQIYFNIGSSTEEVLLAVGGRYDHLLHQMWDNNSKSNPPGAVGTSLALESVIQHSSVEIKPSRHEAGINVLICSRGGGGLVEERMEIADELWRANIKAQFVPISEPSLTEQYEYANEHDIKCLVFITDTGVSQTGSVKVRHLELKKEKEIEREGLVKFLTDAVATQFRNLSIWS